MFRRHDLYIVAAVGLLVALFVAFGSYALHANARLRREQREVLERNRQDTEQLLRVQQDTYQLAELVRDMVMTAPPAPAPAPRRRAPYALGAHLAQPPFAIWGVEFRRLRLDLGRALAAEARFAPAGRGAAARADLEKELAQFWSVSDQAFRLARLGYPQPARDLVERELIPQRRVVNDRVAGWLAQNRREQEAAQAAMEAIASRVAANFLLLSLIFLAIGVAFSVWAIRANRVAFRRMESLAGDLETASARLLRVQEETLARLTRDLHDEFGQLLVAAAANLARAASLAPAAEPVAAEIASARQAVQEAQAKMRNLLHGLRPALLDDFGLERALDYAVGQFRRQTGLAARFETAGAIPLLPVERAIHLYRIAQEAMTNAARHAGAREIVVTLRAEDGNLVLSVGDDGRGFDAARASAGSGLAGMRQRAQFLAGRLEIESAASGTRLRAVVPLAPAARAGRGNG